MKILKIEGFRGIVTVLFIIVCLFAGFAVFPGFVAMTLWNKYLAALLEFPRLNLMQGVLLWGIAVVSYVIIFKGGLAVSFRNIRNELSDSELSMIMRNARIYSNMRNLNKMMQKGDKFEKNSNPYDNKKDKDEDVFNG